MLFSELFKGKAFFCKFSFRVWPKKKKKKNFILKNNRKVVCLHIAVSCKKKFKNPHWHFNTLLRLLYRFDFTINYVKSVSFCDHQHQKKKPNFMAATCSLLASFLLCLALLSAVSFAADPFVSYDFRVSYLTASPLGVPQQVRCFTHLPFLKISGSVF